MPGVQADSNVKELITPPLDGTILPGVTRDSILQLTREWGEFAVSERQLSIKEIKQVMQHATAAGLLSFLHIIAEWSCNSQAVHVMHVYLRRGGTRTGTCVLLCMHLLPGILGSECKAA